MITWLKAHCAARTLGLRDRGKIEKNYVWSADDVAFMVMQTTHAFCNTHVRVGILRKNRRTVHWCYRCEQILPQSNVGDNSGGKQGNKITSPTPSPEYEARLRVATALTRNVIEKMKTPPSGTTR